MEQIAGRSKSEKTGHIHTAANGADVLPTIGFPARAMGA